MSIHFYTRKEMAVMFKVSIYTVDNWIKNKKLTCHKIDGTVRVSDLDIDKFLVLTSKK